VPRQLFATSKDGTKVPMFVTHRKGLQLDGSNPTLLYAYGARGKRERQGAAHEAQRSRAAQRSCQD
jgi:prolyl oligopeptidase